MSVTDEVLRKWWQRSPAAAEIAAAEEAELEARRAVASRDREEAAKAQAKGLPALHAKRAATLEAKDRAIAALTTAQADVLRAHQAIGAFLAPLSAHQTAAARELQATEPAEVAVFLSWLDATFQRIRGEVVHNDTGELAAAIAAIHAARRQAQTLRVAPLTRAAIREALVTLEREIDRVTRHIGTVVTLDVEGKRMFERVEPRRGGGPPRVA
jgi:hypothetical protein